MDEKRFRFDLFIALCALLISTVAAGASAYQTYVIRQQLSAGVWPYLNVDNTFNPGQVTVMLTNYGLGPALVRSAWLEERGKHVRSWNEVFAAFQKPRPGGGHGATRISASSLDGSTVFSPGATKRLIDIRTSGSAVRLLSRVSDVTIHVCYCSLLGQCWLLDTSKTGSPQLQRSCPTGSSIAVSTPKPVGP